MARGDHIRVFRGFYWHHGIDCGDGTVIHYTGTPTNLSDAQIKHDILAVFSQDAKVEVVRYEQAHSAEETLARARSRLNERNYNLAFNNCEHFASWCRCGESRSRQVDTMARTVGGPTVSAAKKVGEAIYNPDMKKESTVKDFFRKEVVRPYSGDGKQRELKLGKNRSIHSRDPVTGRTIPGGQLDMGVDMLGAANLVVGVANLGIGLYNAYKINQVSEQVASTHAAVNRNREVLEANRRGIAEIKNILVDGLQEVQHVLEYQNGMLQSIEQMQQLHDQKLDAIMYTLVEGFHTLEQRIESVTHQRRQDEYVRLVTSLNMAKRDAAEGLAFNGGLSPMELAKLSQRAEELQSWLESRLRSGQLHLLARQPIVIALVEARMARIDALMFESPNNVQRAWTRVRELEAMIADEVQRLHHNVTPWEVVTAVHGQVAVYGTLHRALEQAAALLTETQHSVPQITPWSSGLPALPVSSSQHTTAEYLELKTLDDFEWFIKAFGVDRNSLDVRRLPAIPAKIVAQRLGATELRSDLVEVRPFLMPETWEAYRRAVRDEFGFDPRTSLAPVRIAELMEKSGASSRSPSSHGSDGNVRPIQWNFLGNYSKSTHFFLRQNKDAVYRFDFWNDDRRYRLHLKTGGGNPLQVALLGVSNNKPEGPEFAAALIEAGKATFEIRMPGTYERCQIQLKSKDNVIHVDGQPVNVRNICIQKEAL